MLRAVHARVEFCAVVALACPSGDRPPVAPDPSPMAQVAGARQVALPLPRRLARPGVIARSAPLPGFMKGINFGNCLDAPTESAWGSRLSEQHFVMAAAAGFDHVRLPVRFSSPERAQRVPPFTIDERFFQRVDWAIDRALAHQLSIIIDLHHYDEINEQPQQHRSRLVALWSQIAARYAERPPAVAFEILNEPRGALEPKLINEITREALRVIRDTNPTRVVFADSYGFAYPEELGKLELPADDQNLVAEFHMYYPLYFTHQGASWVPPWMQTRGVLFPGPPDRALPPVPAARENGSAAQWFADYNRLPLDQNPSGPRTVFESFDHASRYVEATSKRVYLGEFGALNTADEQSRVNYLWLVRTEAERRGIGWAYWNDDEYFKVLDPSTGKFDQRLLQALLPSGAARPLPESSQREQELRDVVQ